MLIRPLYSRTIEQVLVTVGLSLAGVALLQAIWGADAAALPASAVDAAGDRGRSARRVPNGRLLLIGAAVVVLAGLLAFLRCTRIGLVIRAGVEDRSMVTALGIDVRRAFTLVFAIGGAAAALAGALGGVYFGSISPEQGGSLLIFAFIVVVIGGMGSVVGSAVRRGRGRAAAAVRQLLRTPGSATSAWSRCSRSCCWCARRGSPERSPPHDDGHRGDPRRHVRRRAAVASGRFGPLVVLVVLIALPYSSI